MAEIIAGPSPDVFALGQLGPVVEDRFNEGDVARLELTFAAWVLPVARQGIRLALDKGLPLADVELVESVAVVGDRLVIQWRKSLGILAGIAIIIGLVILAMFTAWVLFREAPLAVAGLGLGALLLIGVVVLAGTMRRRR